MATVWWAPPQRPGKAFENSFGDASGTSGRVDCAQSQDHRRLLCRTAANSSHRRGAGRHGDARELTIAKEIAAPWAPLGRALSAYLDGNREAVINLEFEDGRRDQLPAAALFRDGGLSPADEMALALADGRVLDVGASAGTITLMLEDAGHTVVALDIDPLAVEVMGRRDVSDPRQGDIFTFMLGPNEEPFDTIIMLMNGIGVAGDRVGLDRLLDALHRLVAPDGIVLVDGADLTRAGDPLEPERMAERDLQGHHPRAVRYQMSYDGEPPAGPFSWLFADPDTLAEAAARAGWWCQLVFEDDDGTYLARLTRTV